MDRFVDYARANGYQLTALPEDGLLNCLAIVLQTVGYLTANFNRAVMPHITLLAMSVIPIYCAAHASLRRPTTAGKALKRKGLPEEDEKKDSPPVESLGPADAILLPLMAGTTLTGLYYLIKWLDDPALLSKILNWYFALLSVFATAYLLATIIDSIFDFIFPVAYSSNGKTWVVQEKDRNFLSISENRTVPSPLPSSLASLPLPKSWTKFLWWLRELPYSMMHLRCSIRGKGTSIPFNPIFIGLVSLSVSLTLYSNLIRPTWWLNNLFGFAFVYPSPRMVSPGTSTTASLILAALFVYDIYFVFFTPIMVTVATSLDIPAKLYIPRPGGGVGIIGLGDLVIPGIVIGWALRFDLWHHYFKQQKTVNDGDKEFFEYGRNPVTNEFERVNKGKVTKTIKVPYQEATGFWGTRFWTGSPSSQIPQILGTQFPKPYFHATLTGYILGMLATDFIMNFYGHAQPALLYLVPGVLGALWLTAIYRGEFSLIFNYVEGESEEDALKKAEEEAKKKEKGGSSWWTWRSMFLSVWRLAEEEQEKADAEKKKKKKKKEDEEKEGKEDGKEKEEGQEQEWAKDQLVHFSITTNLEPANPLVLKDGRLVYQTEGEEEEIKD